MTLDSLQIEALIPHRRPFLFVKSAAIVAADEIDGVVQWDADNPVFQGHFPGFPVVPGVLIIEAGAQLAGILISHNGKARSLAGHEAVQRLGMLIGVKRASFHSPVFANDSLSFKAKLSNPIGGMVSTSIEATGEGGRKVFKGEISVAVVDRSRLAGMPQATVAA